MTDPDEARPAKKRRRTAPELAEVVAEGLYIAVAVTRLALKNRILVETIAHDEDFDVDRFVPDARAILLDLANEADADAERTRSERRSARGRFGDSVDTHDYGRRDVRNLKRRQVQSERVAAELRVRADDAEELRHLVAAARDAAWDEVSVNIDRTLRIEGARPDLDPDYAATREERMESLRLVDLPALAAQRRPDASATDSPPDTT